MFNPDYFKTADEEIAVIVRIETKKTVANVEDICNVEGVDATYIGPADLSASYGHPDNMSHTDVQKAIDRVYDATKAAGLAAGMHEGSGSTIKKRMDEGYNLVTVGNDLIYMRMGV
jgi:2-keto-3-deoxy-L-rhamnonate aldolase RhmA